jgi:hypothetical protein
MKRSLRSLFARVRAVAAPATLICAVLALAGVHAAAADIAPTAPLACTGDCNGDGRIAVTDLIALVAGTTYYIVVGGSGTSAGHFTLSVQ